MTDTPKAQQGTWKLTAPDGRQWRDESPLKVAAQEQRERVSEQVAAERILNAIADAEDDLCLYRHEIFGCSKNYDTDFCGKECEGFQKVPF